ncbi:unnamed protein product [Microthlaspi erraticum]|uniref:Uncharacterized protein n=1 Tax=Microthlaspi erraticum TaxID=1685480 RepID=A0A6D2LLM8_9BRAS|nr:unnamed protein product [Microthlaspi erraticum]
MPLPVNGSLSSNGNAQSVGGAKSIKDEAWDLLRQSIVYYCVSPIGMIAANDPNSTSVLNYDQIFILSRRHDPSTGYVRFSAKENNDTCSSFRVLKGVRGLTDSTVIG